VLSVTFVTAPTGAEALAVGVRPGGDLAPTARSGGRGPLLARVLAGKHRFKGEEGDVRPVLTADGWLVLVGLDEAEDQDDAGLRRIGAALFAAASAVLVYRALATRRQAVTATI